MKVLHLVPAPFGIDGVFGGAERYALELAKNMALKTPTKLLTFGRANRETEYLGGLLEIVLGNSWYVRGLRTNPIHYTMFKHLRWADVIHCHQNHVLSAEIASIYGKLFGKKVFATDLGGGGWGFYQYLKTDHFFHGHLHISNYSRLISGQQEKRWSKVIYGGVDTNRFKPNPLIPKEALVIFVGRILPHKGIDEVIKALPDGLNFEIIGRKYDESYDGYLKNLAKNKSVIFRDECTDSEIVLAYQRARCVILPSVYKDCYGFKTNVPELLGQTLLEGMACGIPGLTTNVASLPEIVKDGISGWIVEPNNTTPMRVALEFIRDYPEICIKYGEASLKNILDNFTWEKTVERCLGAYTGK